MTLRTVSLCFSAALLAACSSAALAPTLPAGAGASAALGQPALEFANSPHFVYWTLFASCSYPQVQFARVPMKATSKDTSYYCSKGNGLHYTSGLRVDSSGRLWVLSFSKSGGTPSEVAVFKLPLKATSVQLYTFVLSGSNAADALAFDPSGNLWVSSPGNSSVLEYKGPFKKSGTLNPALTVGVPSGYSIYSLAFDKSGKLYASNSKSTGSNSIGVLKPPYTGNPYFLRGAPNPGGLVFDRHGNLYASANGSTPAVVRYNSNHLKSGDKPSIVDPTGIPASSYEAAFAFTSTGDLYAANCGNASSAGIDVWPLSRKKFGAKLKPSVLYTNADVQQAGCAWGIAIK
ncbi:MAG TPA: hypothetical protein VMT95_12190 [Candidatus Binatia bacterium]|nr:hypothetical protein [Candidatus Binatia bacterium]